MKRTKVVDALKSTDFGKEINVKGWVRTHRSSKAVDFIALNDGSTIKNIQVVVDPAKFDAAPPAAAPPIPSPTRALPYTPCASTAICACAPIPSEP